MSDDSVDRLDYCTVMIPSSWPSCVELKKKKMFSIGSFF